MSSVPSPKNAYEQYASRAPMRPGPNLGLDDYGNSARSHADESYQMFRMCFQMLHDHAMHIDKLKTELQETNDFMRWVSETHREAFSEYKAIKDLTNWGKE